MSRWRIFCARALGKVVVLIDTTVFVDLFRGKKAAQYFLLKATKRLRISRVVLMELIRGLRSRKDINVLNKQLVALRVEIIEINEEISQTAGELFEKYYHAHGLGIMDALVAASALLMGDELVTHNKKHFQFVPGLTIVVPY